MVERFLRRCRADSPTDTLFARGEGASPTHTSHRRQSSDTKERYRLRQDPIGPRPSYLQLAQLISWGRADSTSCSLYRLSGDRNPSLRPAFAPSEASIAHSPRLCRSDRCKASWTMPWRDPDLSAPSGAIPGLDFPRDAGDSMWRTRRRHIGARPKRSCRGADEWPISCEGLASCHDECFNRLRSPGNWASRLEQCGERLELLFPNTTRPPPPKSLGHIDSGWPGSISRRPRRHEPGTRLAEDRTIACRSKVLPPQCGSPVIGHGWVATVVAHGRLAMKMCCDQFSRPRIWCQLFLNRDPARRRRLATRGFGM